MLLYQWHPSLSIPLCSQEIRTHIHIYIASSRKLLLAQGLVRAIFSLVPSASPCYSRFSMFPSHIAIIHSSFSFRHFVASTDCPCSIISSSHLAFVSPQKNESHRFSRVFLCIRDDSDNLWKWHAQLVQWAAYLLCLPSSFRKVGGDATDTVLGLRVLLLLSPVIFHTLQSMLAWIFVTVKAA